MTEKTDVKTFLDSLDAGIFAEKVGAALSGVALAVLDVSEYIGNGKVKGSVSLDFEITRIGDSYQVNVSHTIKTKKPTRYGATSEVVTKSTPMMVHQGGVMQLPVITDQVTDDQPPLFNSENYNV